MESLEIKLRKKAMDLPAELMLGKNGITENFVKELTLRLHRHKLVKLKVHKSMGADRNRIAEKLALDCAAELIEVKGHTIVLFKKTGMTPSTAGSRSRKQSKPKNRRQHMRK